MGFFTNQPAKINPQIALTKLETMSVDWLDQLYQAAEVVDDEYLSELIAQIPQEKADLAEILTELMKEFRVDKIIDLSKQAFEQKNR